MNGWGLAFTYARRELRGGIKGFRIFLACLFLGVAVISAVGSLSSAIVGGLARDARSILGGDVAIRQIHQAIAPEQLDWLRRESAGVAEMIEMRAMAIRPDDGRRTLVQLKAVGDTYPLVGTLTFASQLPGSVFAVTDGTVGAAIEKTLATRLDLKLGDRLKVGEAAVEVRAILDKEPDRSVSAIDFGPRLMVGLAAMPATDLLQPGSLAEYHYKMVLKPGDTIADFRARLLAAFPDPQWRVRDLGQASPQIERFVERIGLFLTLVGLTALLVGGVGVGNAVGSYLSGKTSTIATWKALGAPAGLIFKTYLMLVMAMALLGTLGGTLLGSVAPFAVEAFFGAILPVPIAAGFYPVPLLSSLAFGILTALAFSLWPLGRAREVPAAALFRDVVAPRGGRPRWTYLTGIAVSSVLLAGLAIVGAARQDLAAWFVGGVVASFILFRLAGRGLMAAAKFIGERRRNPRLRLALANLHRPGAPTGSMVLSLGLGLTVLVTVALLEGNLNNQVAERLPERAPSFFFVDLQSSQVADFEQLVKATPGQSDLQRTPTLRGRIIKVNGVPADQVRATNDQGWVLDSDRGLTYSATMPEGSKIVAGQWWGADYSGPPLIAFESRAAAGLGVGVGDTLTVNVLGREVTGKIAVLREIEWGNLALNFAIVFSPGLLDKAPHTHIATVHVPPAQEEALLRSVTDRFPNVTAVRVQDALDAATEVLEGIAAAARAVTLLTLSVGTLVLAGAMLAGHHRRVYDAVVLKVLGATRRDIAGAFLLEYGLLGLGTGLVAAAVGITASWAVTVFLMRAQWVFLPGTVMVTILICLALTLAIGFAGTWRALGQKAGPLLRNA
ncbi:ABC transporter permease [Lacibacterium aquatile]|uniref:ABC transporter permease n=1 Tax=Lacibacterium aquatile TaxID=1168082 RepID=A0ABW5DMJ8_9PROT